MTVTSDRDADSVADEVQAPNALLARAPVEAAERVQAVPGDPLGSEVLAA